MKRDMDLVRLILQKIEMDEPLKGIEGFTQPQVNYHVAIMIDAHLVIGITGSSDNSAGVDFAIINRMTWQGHDFLQAAKDDTVWKKAKDHISQNALPWTFAVLQEALRKFSPIP